MGFWARSLVEVARRVLCTGEVPGVAFEVEVPEDFLRTCLGVLGLMGTEATLDGGRGLKPRSYVHKVYIGGKAIYLRYLYPEKLEMGLNLVTYGEPCPRTSMTLSSVDLKQLTHARRVA